MHYKKKLISSLPQSINIARVYLAKIFLFVKFLETDVVISSFDAQHPHPSCAAFVFKLPTNHMQDVS
jgi:hypothetical protein